MEILELRNVMSEKIRGDGGWQKKDAAHWRLGWQKDGRSEDKDGDQKGTGPRDAVARVSGSDAPVIGVPEERS